MTIYLKTKRFIELEKQAKRIYTDNNELERALICSGKILAYKHILKILENE